MRFCEGGEARIFLSILFSLSAIDFSMTTILKNPRAYATSVLKDESTLSRITTKVWTTAIIKTLI